jgi:hypothetical protein
MTKQSVSGIEPAPAGFIEAGTSDFFVPRGYVHVIASIGTSSVNTIASSSRLLLPILPASR